MIHCLQKKKERRIHLEAELLYKETETYQKAVESILSQKEKTKEKGDLAAIAAALNFQKESLEESIARAWKVRENYAFLASSTKDHIKTLEDRIKELKARAGEFEQKAGEIDEVIKTGMQSMKESKLVLPEVTIEVKASAQKVVIDDEDRVPDELRNPAKKPEPSKTALKSYLLENPDCEFAHLERTVELKYKV